jgi:hypothetical protein
MSDHESLERQLQGANPVPALDALHREELLAVRSLLDRRRGRMATPERASRRTLRWRKPAVAVATAFMLTIAAGTAAYFAFGRSEKPTSATTATSLPATTLPPVTTTTLEVTTTIPAAVVIPEGAVLTWTRIPDTTGALIGETWDYVNQVIAGGPGLVAVGAADTCVGCWGAYPEQELIGFDHAREWTNHQGGAVWLSADGEAWTQVPASMFGDGVAMLTGVADNGSRLVAVGITAVPDGAPDGATLPRSAVWISDDAGTSWTRVPDDEAAFGGEGRHLMWSVIATDRGFTAAGDDLWTSLDGSAWTRVGPMDEVRRIVRTDEGYVAVGLTSSAAAVWTSSDAVSWTRVELPAVSAPPGVVVRSALTDAAGGPGGVVVVGQVQETSDTANNSDGAVWVATGGGSWLRVQADSEVFTGTQHQEIRGVALFGEYLVVVGTQRPGRFQVYQPGDDRFGDPRGRTWVRVESESLGSRGSDISMTAVVGFGDKVIAVGNDGEDLAVWIGTWE